MKALKTFHLMKIMYCLEVENLKKYSYGTTLGENKIKKIIDKIKKDEKIKNVIGVSGGTDSFFVRPSCKI